VAENSSERVVTTYRTTHSINLRYYYYYLFILTANRFLPGGSGTKILVNGNGPSRSKFEITAQSVWRLTTGWTAGVRFRAGVRDISLFHGVQTDSGSTQPPVQWVLQGFSWRRA
jgi:hypothetical protein